MTGFQLPRGSVRKEMKEEKEDMRENEDELDGYEGEYSRAQRRRESMYQ